MAKFNPQVLKEWINSILKLAAAALVILISILTFKAFIEDEVYDISKSEKFLKDLASQINPFLIFDSNESYLYDGGALQYIENIEVINGIHSWFNDSTQAPVKIVITTNRVLSFEPQISCLDLDVKGDITVNRGPKTTWIFDLSQWLSNDPGGIDTFRIDLIP